VTQVLAVLEYYKNKFHSFNIQIYANPRRIPLEHDWPHWQGRSTGGVSQESHCGGPGSIPGQVGFMMDKVTMGPVLSEYFGFP
jgi:hypothetical protein